jgi:two-component system, NarL family, sensor kinase
MACKWFESIADFLDQETFHLPDGCSKVANWSTWIALAAAMKFGIRSFRLVVSIVLSMHFCALAQYTPGSLVALDTLVGKDFIDAVSLLPYNLVVDNLDACHTLFISALNYSDELGYTLGKAESHRNLALVTYLQGRYPSSVEHNQKAILLYRSLGLTGMEGDQYCNMGFQMKSRDLDMAVDYMLKGMHMLEAVQDSGRLTGVYDNYGVLKLMADEADSAIHYYQRALELKYSFNDSLGIPYSLNKLGEIYLMRKDLAAARKAFDEAYRIRKVRNDLFGIMENQACLGDYFLAASQPDSAIYWFDKALSSARSLGYPFMVRNCLEQLSFAYEMKGDLGMALQKYRQFAAMSDSLKNDLRLQQVTELELRFGTSEKERENSLLRQQKAEQQLALTRQRAWIIGLSAGTLLLLAMGLLALQRYRQREAAKRDAAIIAERERGLRAIILATEEERKRIAKDLHDGIVQTLTGIGLQLQRSSATNPDVGRSRAVLNEAIAEVREISHRMMPRALAELGLVPAVADMLGKTLGAASIRYAFDHHGMEQRLAETMEVALYRIAQELVNNILKHARAKEVTVQLMRSTSHLLLMVEDDGVGIDSQTPMTNGIGLTNIQSRVNALNGTVSFSSGDGGGTVVMVRVPVMEG